MIKRTFMLVAVCILSSSCAEIFPTDKCAVELVRFTTNSGRPAVVAVAKNTGDLDIYNVSCDALAMKGSTVIDSAFMYFAGGATIRPGQSAEDTGTWFGLSSHDQYDTVSWQCGYLVND